MGHQLELHTTCQAVCDALMGMIFGMWGSKHEPRPIREKDVLAIKGNKESWLRCDGRALGWRATGLICRCPYFLAIIESALFFCQMWYGIHGDYIRWNSRSGFLKIA